MRIILKTDDEETERRFAAAARQRDGQTLCVLHAAAQVLERQYRDPFDALLADADRQPIGWVRDYAALCPKNVFLLLPAASLKPQPPAVVYAFLKPYAPETVLDRVVSLSAQSVRNPKSTLSLISVALQSVGVPAHLYGFPLLSTAIRLTLAHRRPTALSMEKDIYAPLAEDRKKSVSVIEHAMRHAIEAAWVRADARVLEQRFGYTVSAERAVPSNEAFIFQLCEYIRLQQKEDL